MTLQRTGIYVGAALVVGVGVWFFGGAAVDAVIASRLEAHQAKYEALVKDKEAEIRTNQQEMTALAAERDQALKDVQKTAKEAEKLATEKLAWMRQADALAKRLQAVQEEVARVPDAQLGQEIRAALADIRTGVSTACPIR